MSSCSQLKEGNHLGSDLADLGLQRYFDSEQLSRHHERSSIPYVQDVAIAIKKEGGMVRIALKLDASGSKRLGALRAQCIIPNRTLTHHNGPVDYIPLQHNLPASKIPLFDKALASLASSRQSYQLRVGMPFITRGTSHPLVFFAIESRETTETYQELSKILKDIRLLNFYGQPKPNFRPRFMVEGALSPEEAEQTLKNALQKYEAGIENVTGIGLALYHEKFVAQCKRMSGHKLDHERILVIGKCFRSRELISMLVLAGKGAALQGPTNIRKLVRGTSQSASAFPSPIAQNIIILARQSSLIISDQNPKVYIIF